MLDNQLPGTDSRYSDATAQAHRIWYFFLRRVPVFSEDLSPCQLSLFIFAFYRSKSKSRRLVDDGGNPGTHCSQRPHVHALGGG